MELDRVSTLVALVFTTPVRPRADGLSVFSALFFIPETQS